LIVFQALDNAQQLRDQLTGVTVNSTAGQYSADSIEALFAIERVSAIFLLDVYFALTW